jgi:enamine deaminase RidA (YjgF/YER057c/UK114 family)
MSFPRLRFVTLVTAVLRRNWDQFTEKYELRPKCRVFQHVPPKLAWGTTRGAIGAGLHAAARCATQSGPDRVYIAFWSIKRGRNMAGTVEQKLAAQGVVLHEPASPVANYVGFVRTGNLLFVSGQVCLNPEGKLIAKGKLGAGVTAEQGNAAARGCAINLLAQIKAALGDLDKVVRVVRLGGFINSAPDFLDGPKVLNGASDLMVLAFGDKGRHARTTVGVASLPADAAVEVEGVFEVS